MHKKFENFGEIPEYRILQLAASLFHDKKCKKDVIINHLGVSELKDNWDKLITYIFPNFYTLHQLS
jgi:hypothetical protein